MALGKKIVEFDVRDMIRGMATSDVSQDGGFSPSTDAVNLTYVPGVVYAPTQPTDASTNVAGEIIASTEDGQAISSVDRVFVDDEGHFYSWNGTTMTLARTDGAHNYSQGKTDMAGFDGSVFTTSDTTLVKWVVDASFDATFVSGLTSTVPHPLLVYENNLYIGDKNVLKRITDASDSTPDSMLTLATNQVIVALGIDPGTGKMLISVTSSLNISGTLNNNDRVLYYNGTANKADKVVLVDEMITAFFPVGSTMFIGYGQNLGYWNGAGIQFLRHLDIAFDSATLLYKQHFTNIGENLYVIENTQVLSFGEVLQRGEPVFAYVFKNNENSNKFTHICSIGQNKLGLAFATDKFFTWDSSSVSTTYTQDFYSNPYTFDDEVWIRRARIIYKDQVGSNVSPGSIRFRDQDGVITSVGSSGSFLLTNTSGAASAFKDIENIDVKVKQIQFELILSTGNFGIRRVILYGDPANIT